MLDLGISLVALTEFLVIVFAGHAIMTLFKATDFSSSIKTAAVLITLGLLAWGAIWMLVPTLVELRLNARPTQPVAIGLSLAILLAVTSTLVVHRPHLGLALAFWRVVFGFLLIAIGLAGGLPQAFYPSAGLGDILVGVWGMWLRGLGDEVSPRAFRWWNVAGLVDLAHVLGLGAMTLLPFFQANPGLPPLTLLPLVGVPMFIALHVALLRAGQRLSRSVATSV